MYCLKLCSLSLLIATATSMRARVSAQQRMATRLNVSSFNLAEADPFEYWPSLEPFLQQDTATAIGEGSFGTIYKVEAACGGAVAVKRIGQNDIVQFSDCAQVVEETFTQIRMAEIGEALPVYLLDPMACPAYGGLSVVMDLAAGSLEPDFDAFDGSALPESILFDIAHQIIRGLRALHRLDIVHRDVKPANILVQYPRDVSKHDRDKGWKHLWQVYACRFVLADFGLSRTGKALSSEKARVGGSPEYVPPEVAVGTISKKRAQQGFAQDYWALGTTLFEIYSSYFPRPYARLKLHRSYQEGAVRVMELISSYSKSDTSMILETWMEGFERLRRDMAQVETELSPSSHFTELLLALLEVKPSVRVKKVWRGEVDGIMENWRAHLDKPPLSRSPIGSLTPTPSCMDSIRSSVKPALTHTAASDVMQSVTMIMPDTLYDRDLDYVKVTWFDRRGSAGRYTKYKFHVNGEIDQIRSKGERTLARSLPAIDIPTLATLTITLCTDTRKSWSANRHKLASFFGMDTTTCDPILTRANKIQEMKLLVANSTGGTEDDVRIEIAPGVMFVGRPSQGSVAGRA